MFFIGNVETAILAIILRLFFGKIRYASITYFMRNTYLILTTRVIKVIEPGPAVYLFITRLNHRGGVSIFESPR